MTITLGSIGILGAIIGSLATFYQTFIKPKLTETNKTAEWRKEVELRVKALEKSDNRDKDDIANIRMGLEQIREELTDQRQKTTEMFHQEIRRLDNRMSEGVNSLRVDMLNFVRNGKQ